MLCLYLRIFWSKDMPATDMSSEMLGCYQISRCAVHVNSGSPTKLCNPPSPIWLVLHWKGILITTSVVPSRSCRQSFWIFTSFYLVILISSALFLPPVRLAYPIPTDLYWLQMCSNSLISLPLFQESLKKIHHMHHMGQGKSNACALTHTDTHARATTIWGCLCNDLGKAG